MKRIWFLVVFVLSFGFCPFSSFSDDDIGKLRYGGKVIQIEYFDVQSRIPVSSSEGFTTLKSDETILITSTDFTVCVAGKLRLQKRIVMYYNDEWICFGKDKAVCFSMCRC